MNTTMYRPLKIVALYKVQTIGKFISYDHDVNWVITEDPTNIFKKYNKWKLANFDYDEEGQHDNLEAENVITECLGVHRVSEWSNIRGGKYVRQDVIYKLPDKKDLLRLPLCECGYPCDIKKNQEKGLLFFRCAKKNMFDALKSNFDVEGTPCKFYREYTHDLPLRKAEEERSLKYRTFLARSTWLSCAPYDDVECICCGEESYRGVNYDGGRAVCEDCFLNRNEEAEAMCKPLAKKMILSLFKDD